MSALRGLSRACSRTALLAAVVVAVPAASVHPTTISLTTIGTAKAVDAGDGVLWVLALGAEAGPGDDVLQARTDAIQLIGVHWRTGRAVAIGLPRDLYVRLPEPDGMSRLNEALEKTGVEGVAREVDELVGITPDLVLVTGFEGFVSMMRAVGDVQVDSPFGFTTESGDLVVQEGPTTLDPEQALDYASTRVGLPESDYDRVANHQRLLLGVLARLHEAEDQAGFLEQATLSALAGMETDLSPADAFRIIQALTTIDPGRTTACIVRGTPRTEFDAEVLVPDLTQVGALGADARDDARLQDGCPGGPP